METMMIAATLAGVLAGVGVSWICWRMFSEEDAPSALADARSDGAAGNGRGNGSDWSSRGAGGAERVLLEPEVAEEDVRSFYAKLDAVERNVPVALVAEWKQMAAERMAAAKSAEEFAFAQGRLAAFGEMERAFLEMAKELRGAEAANQDGEDADA